MPTSYLGRVLSRNRRDVFGIKRDDRFSHVHIIGRTGTGKSTLLESMLKQDMRAGAGIALVDPHGDLAERVVQVVPESRSSHLLYFNVPDQDQPYGCNPLRFVSPDKRTLAAGGLLEVFEKMWPNAWGVRMEHILRNAILALLEVRGATLPDLLRLFSDESYRRSVTSQLSNSQVRAFWEHEYPNYSYRLRADGIAPIQNKVGAFLADPNLRRILTNPEKPLRIRQIMDEGRILIVNLAKGQLGEDTASLLGGLLVTTIGLAAFSRADIPEAGRRPFFLYIDEFQSFTTLAVANMLSELRKYRVGLVLAHQYLDQLEPEVRYAVLGNTGTIISFRLGAKDAGLIAKEFAPTFSNTDLMRLPNYHIYLKLMIDGAPSQPFSATTLGPNATVGNDFR